MHTAAADAFLRKGAKTRNEGANPFLRVNRDRREQTVVGFDLGDIDPATVADARLVMTIADNHDNWGKKGDRTIHNHPLLVEFTEGNGVNSIVPGAERSRGSGAGTTWMCATDHDISNGHHDCEFPRWFGGDYFQPETGIVAIANSQTGEVVFDVTGDVQAGFDSWLMARGEDGSSGRLDFYSKEHPDVVANAELAPRLVITVAAPPGSVTWADDELDLAEPRGNQITVPVAATIDADLPPSVEVSSGLADVVERATLIRVGDAGEHVVNLTVNFTATATGELRVVVDGISLEPALPVTVRSLDPAADVVPIGMPAPASDRVDTTGPVPFVTEELLILIASPASEADALAIASDLGAVAAGLLPEGIVLLRWLDTDLTIEELETLAATHPAVLTVSRNVGGVGVARVPETNPDPRFDPWDTSTSNWHLKAVRAPLAWDTTVGSADVKVGFVDTGYNIGHTDLKDRLVEPHPLEHVEDHEGERTYHGNHVAGIACAEGNNGIGITGVAWTCAASLYEATEGGWLSTQLGGLGGFAANLFDGLSQAVRDGNRIVNMSMGLWKEPGCPWKPFSPKELDGHNQMFDAIVKLHTNTLFVFAAGNGCTDVANAPGKDENAYSSDANVIIVAALNEDLELAERFPNDDFGSNFGSGVSIAAPGVNILSLGNRICVIFEPLCDNLYALKSGTSMAAPLVTGAATLVLSKNPTLTASQVKTCLVDAASSRPVPNRTFGVLDIPGSLAACSPTMADEDGDGVPDEADNCRSEPNAPSDPNELQDDLDGDGVGNACDNCSMPNAGQADRDGDNAGDLCDTQPDDPTSSGQSSGRTGGSYGHPSLITFDGLRYLFHGAGDYLLAESTVDTFAVHARFGRAFGMTNVSFNRGLAATVGASILAFGDGPATVFDPIPVTLDGAIIEVPGDGTPVDLPGSATIRQTTRCGLGCPAHQVDWPTGERLQVGTRVGDDFILSVPPSRFAQMRGLLGDANGSRDNDGMAADGAPVDLFDRDELYDVFGASWLLDPEDSLFATLADPLDILPIFPGDQITLADLPADAVAAAEAECLAAGVQPRAGLEQCAFDVAITGFSQWIASALAISDVVRGSTPAVSARPLVESTTNIAIGDAVTGSIDAPMAVDDYLFTGTAGDTPSFAFTADCQSSTLALDVYSPQGARLLTLQAWGCGSATSPALPADGEYVVRVYDVAGYTPAYSFTTADGTIEAELDVSFIAPPGAFPDQDFDYTLQIDNVGQTTASDVQVEVVLPDVGQFVSSDPAGTPAQPAPGTTYTISLGEIPAGGLVRAFISWRAPSSSGAEATSTATVRVGDGDPLPPVAVSVPIGLQVDCIDCGVTAAGVGLRNRSEGTIEIEGLPDDAVVARAVLVWGVLYQGAEPSDAITLNGTQISAELATTVSDDLCWGDTATVGYAADVTALVTGNGSYVVSDPPRGTTRVDDNPVGVLPYTDGASLIVIYTGTGADSQVLADFTYGTNTAGPITRTFEDVLSTGAGASLTLAGPDGQTDFGEQFTITGAGGPITLQNTWNGSDPQAGPSFAIGNLWDTDRYDVSSILPAGQTTLTFNHSFTGSDCIGVSAAVLDVAQS